MPIKKQSSPTNRGIRKKSANKKMVFFGIAMLFFAFFIAGYLFFKGPSGTTTSGSIGKAEGPVNATEQVEPVAIDGFRGTVMKARLQMEAIDNKDVVKVIVEKTSEANDKEIFYRYEWSINGQPAGTGSDSISGFKRGDKVAVKITPFDGEKPGNPRTLTVDVQNTPPKVSESKEPKYDGKTFTAQINASDPDGDQLSYELLNGPEGMTIDKKSGVVNWSLKENNGGDYPVKVKITDGHRGEVTYQLTATIPKEPPPPATIPKKSP
jgi:hypothetical protein